MRFRLRSGSKGLFEDKKISGMLEEDRCVLCNVGKVEDVKHFVLECEEFDQDTCQLLERIKGIVGADVMKRMSSEFTTREKSTCE